MKIFRLGTKLQLFVYNNGTTFKISKLIVGHIQRFVLGRKVTLQTLCAYDHHLRTLFMERRPGLNFLTIFSALETSEYLFFSNDTLLIAKIVQFFQRLVGIKRNLRWGI